MYQANEPTGGGARDGGKRRVASQASLRSRWVRIFSITAGSSMQAMILTRPPQVLQVSSGTSMYPTAARRSMTVQIGSPADLSMSTLNTRFRRWAQGSWLTGVRRALCLQAHPTCRPCCPCLAWPASPAHDARRWGRTRRDKFIGNEEWHREVPLTDLRMEDRATLPTELSHGSLQLGRVCSVNTWRPFCGPTAMRYVIEWPKSSSSGPASMLDQHGNRRCRKGLAEFTIE